MVSLPQPAPPTPAASPAAQVRSERFVGLTLLVGIIAAVVVLGLLTWLAREMLEGETLRFDEAVRGAVHSVAGPGLTRLMLAASRFGSPVWLGPVGAVIALYFFARGWRRAALLLPLTLIGTGILDTLLKYSFQRARPTAFFDYPLPTSYSFPSGHAMFSFCFFTVLAALLSPRLARPELRVLTWTLAIAAALLIGLSRIYLGVHYPSDVIAGYGTGFVWVVVVAFGDRVAHRIKHGQA